MPFDIEWHPSVRRVLRKLPQEISTRIVKKVKTIIDNPFRYLEHYAGDSRYKLRIGAFRLLIEVDFQKKVLKIQILDKRSRIYRR
jgi:mRNA-degrading endonuclease RelE of RelBE toxin-antitoxin system